MTTIYKLKEFTCPFTEERILLPSSKWESYIKGMAKNQTAESLSVICINETNPKIKKIIEDILINLHNSVEQ